MKFELVTDSGALDGLRDEWDSLWQSDPAADVFCSWAWFRCWWTHFGAGPGRLVYHRRDGPVELPYRRALLHVLTLRDGQHGLLAVAPLICLTSRWRRWPVRVLSPPNNGHGPRSGLLAGTPAAAAALVEKILREPGWDVLLIDGYARHSGAWQALAPALAHVAGRVVAGANWRHLILPMAGRFDAYLHTRRSHFRKRERQARNALAELGEVDIVCHRAPGAVALAMAQFVAVDASSWKACGGEALSAHPALAAYYRELAQRFAQQGRCHVWVMSIAKQPAATFLALCAAARVYLIKISQARRFASARHAPGRVLLAHLIRCYWDEGKAALDFVGDMPFVERWSGASVDFSARAVFAPGLYPRLVHGTEMLMSQRRGSHGADVGRRPEQAAGACP